MPRLADSSPASCTLENAIAVQLSALLSSQAAYCLWCARLLLPVSLKASTDCSPPHQWRLLFLVKRLSQAEDTPEQAAEHAQQAHHHAGCQIAAPRRLQRALPTLRRRPRC